MIRKHTYQYSTPLCIQLSWAQTRRTAIRNYKLKPKRSTKCLQLRSRVQDDIGVRKRHFAVIGGGFAGIATAWYLLKYSTPEDEVHVDVYDANGIGCGASGAAAGLLHPFTPKGKVLWKGQEAMEAVWEVIHAAEATAGSSTPFVWHHGVIRPAMSANQARSFAKLWGPNGSELQTTGSPSARCLSHQEAAVLVPGLQVPGWQTPEETKNTADQIRSDQVYTSLKNEAPVSSVSYESSEMEPISTLEGGVGCKVQRRGQRKRGSSVADAGCDALLVEAGATVDVQQYLRALWKACQDSERAELRVQRISGLGALQAQRTREGETPYEAIIVAAGAGAATLEELSGRDGHLTLPLQLCQGATLVMAPPSESPEDSYPTAAPSILGQPYFASWGPSTLVVGATRQNLEGSLSDAAEESLVQVSQGSPNADAAAAAEVQLLPEAMRIWKPLERWHVQAIRSGVRANPPRTSSGSLPLLGRISDTRSWWLCVGLGSRGMVYHAWLAKLVTHAIMSGHNEEEIPYELRAWKAEHGSLKFDDT